MNLVDQLIELRRKNIIRYISKRDCISIRQAEEFYDSLSSEEIDALVKEKDDSERESEELAKSFEKIEQKNSDIKHLVDKCKKNTPERFKGVKLSDFNNTPFSSVIQDAIDKDVLWLLLGTNGVGKTRFAWALANEWASMGYTTCIMTATQFTSLIRMSTQTGKDTCELIRERFEKIDKIIIDEIDKIKGTENDILYISDLINIRYEQCRHLFLFGNIHSKDFLEEAERLLGKSAVSRLTGDGAITPCLIISDDRRTT